MKDFNPFAGIAQFVMSCIVLIGFVGMTIGQICMARAWHSWMFIMLIIVGLCVWMCVLTWREYKQGK